ncbi:MAG: alpha/beta hydrolase [Pseudomonadota bacterium]
MNTVTLSAAATLLATTALADVQTRTFTFENEGSTLSGTLYLPADFDGAPMPTVIVTGAWTSVEEQMPKTYAEAMVERGFAAVTFDFRGWGKSGDIGTGVRFKEDPGAKISDLRAAIATVAGMEEVDAAQLNGLGICASAGYMVDATSGNPLINKVGLVAPWLQNEDIVNAVYGGEDGVSGLIEMGRAAEAQGGQIITAAGPIGAKGVLMPLGGYYYEPSRGAIPAYDNQWNNTSWEGWLTYHPADSASDFDKPLAIVHSEAAAIPEGVQSFVANVAGMATVEWLENVTQFDFYDIDANVSRAADSMAAHFTQ